MFTRISKYSLKNILRNKFLSFSSILVLTLLMFFINILVLLHDISFKLISSINSKMTISLYLNDGYDRNSVDVIDLMEDLKNVTANEENQIGIDYKTKEEILEEIRYKEPALVKILERKNPLPETIVLSEISLDKYEQINRVVENKLYLLATQDDNKEYFANYTSQYERIKSIIGVLDILQIGLYVIIGIFIISISIIIYSVVGNFIYYYRDEIYITRLVGGSKKFIYGPFILQGSIYSFVASLFSTLVFILILNNLNSTFEDMYMFSFETTIFVIEMLLFVFIGGFAGYLSSKKYLK